MKPIEKQSAYLVTCSEFTKSSFSRSVRSALKANRKHVTRIVYK